MQELLKYLAKFSAVGIIAFVIDYVLLVGFTELLDIPYLWSTTLAFILSILFSYVASMRFIYAPREDLSGRKQMLLYFMLSGVGLVLNDLLMFLFTSVAGILYLFSKLLADLLVSVWNFWSRRRYLDANARPAKVEARLNELDANLTQLDHRIVEYQEQAHQKLAEYQEQFDNKFGEYQRTYAAKMKEYRMNISRTDGSNPTHSGVRPAVQDPAKQGDGEHAGEYVDVYDENRQLTGLSVLRGTFLEPGQYQLFALAVIQNTEGKYLITQRSQLKSWGAGWWEIPGGGVGAGETSESTIVREIAEEVGLDATDAERRVLLTYKNVDAKRGHNYFTDIYGFRFAFAPEDVKLQIEESVDFRLVDWEDIVALHDQGIFLHYERLCQALGKVPAEAQAGDN